MKIVSKKEAIEKKLNKYFTGKSCKNGHVDYRYVKDNNCKTCKVENFRNWVSKNTEYNQKRAKEYYWENIDEVKRKKKENYVPGKRKEYGKQYRKDNKELFAAKSAKRRAYKIKASPAWADNEKIKAIYLSCPEGFHVDHIIPLNNELVCGLHVENNLQYLTPEENFSKKNNFTPYLTTAGEHDKMINMVEKEFF
jgi:hypothetical protein